MTHQTAPTTIRTVLPPLLLPLGNLQVTTIHLTTKVTLNTPHFFLRKVHHRLYNQGAQGFRQELDQATATLIMPAPLDHHLTTQRRYIQTLWEGPVSRQALRRLEAVVGVYFLRSLTPTKVDTPRRNKLDLVVWNGQCILVGILVLLAPILRYLHQASLSLPTW